MAFWECLPAFRLCTFCVPSGCLPGVVPFTAKPALSLHLCAMLRDSPSARELKTLALLPACTRCWEHDSLWWITRWWRQRRSPSLSFPSSTALLLHSTTSLWNKPMRKARPKLKPIHFPDLLQSSTTASAVLAGSLPSQLRNSSVHTMESYLVPPQMLTMASQRTSLMFNSF